MTVAERGPEVTTISGSQRAAILLLSLGEDQAAAVLKHMSPKEVQRVGAAMAALNSVPKAVAGQVMQDFVSTLDEQTALGGGSDDYIRNMLVSALGEDKASSLINRILLGRNSRGLEALKWMDARAVAESVRTEHPQIVAIVLSYLDADHAAQVLAVLPDSIRADLLMRISSLDGIQPVALQELDEILEKQFSGNNNLKSSMVGGVKIAANILNFMDASLEGRIIEKVREADQNLAQQIQDLMFVFDDLAKVDDRGIQNLLREVPGDQLILALKGADPALKEKVFSNMSKRAGETLREELENKGPVKISDVEAAQKEILKIARRLADAQELVLSGKGAEEYV
jgi:flagellar motor switch protein FliG